MGDSKISTRGFTVQVGNETLPDLLSTMNTNDDIPEQKKSLLCSEAKEAAAAKWQKFQKIQLILVPKCSFWSKKIHTHTWSFHSQIKKFTRVWNFKVSFHFSTSQAENSEVIIQLGMFCDVIHPEDSNAHLIWAAIRDRVCRRWSLDVCICMWKILFHTRCLKYWLKKKKQYILFI